MSNVRSIRDAKTASRQASEWLVLLESGEATASERARFDAWRREHPANQAAFDDLKHTWGRLLAMGEHVRTDWAAEPDPDVLVKKNRARSGNDTRHAWFAWSTAAAVFVAAAIGLLLYPFDSATVYRTETGQQTTIALRDGSTVQLNTETELRVAYTDAVRRVEMHRGEAYFDVASDAERPFVVEAGHGTIRAVGTGFVVQMKSDEVVAVTVTEGVVQVTPEDGVPPDPVLSGGAAAALPAPTLREGQRIEYDRHVGRPAEVPPEELSRNLAWRHGMLIFDGQTLDEVIREVGRYTDTELVITDGELRDLRIGGAFRAGDIEALLEVLEKGFDIAVQRRGPPSGPQTVYLGASRSAGSG